MVTITLLNNNKFVNKEKKKKNRIFPRVSPCHDLQKGKDDLKEWRAVLKKYFFIFIWHPLIFWTRFRGSNNSNKKKELNNKILLVLYDFLILWAGERFTLKPFYFMPSARGGFSLRSGTDGKIPGYFDVKKRWNTYILFFKSGNYIFNSTLNYVVRS